MDRLESMEILTVVAEAGSLSAAGRRLGMPLPTVSRKVSSLEAHLKARLLNRSSRRMELTEIGRAYVESCRRILEQIRTVEEAAGGDPGMPRGELVVTAPIVFGRLHVLPAVTAFLREYPQIDVRLVLADRVVGLLEEHIDVALRIGALPNSSLVATRVGAIRRVLCGSPEYLARRGTPRRPADLEAHDCITFDGLQTPHSWTFRTRRAVTSVRVRSRLTVSTAEAALDAAIAGGGVTTVLSYQAARAVSEGKLRLVMRSYDSPPSPVSLVYPEGRWVPPKLRAFLDFAAPRLRGALEPRESTESRLRRSNPRSA